MIRVWPHAIKALPKKRTRAQMNYGKILSLCSAVAITAAGLVVMTSPAFAKAPVVVTAPAPEDLVVRRITYADLNMASAAGERTLNRRVGGAVDSLCSE